MAFVMFIPLILMVLAGLVGLIGWGIALVLMALWKRSGKRGIDEDDAEETSEKSQAPWLLILAIIIAVLTLYVVVRLAWEARYFGAGGL